jgi:hypothetical protein
VRCSGDSALLARRAAAVFNFGYSHGTPKESIRVGMSDSVGSKIVWVTLTQ